MEGARALVVGIGAYRHIDPLGPVVAKDARDVRDVLADPTRCAYPDSGVALLADESATREAILTALGDLAAPGAEGPVFIYFSCHGAQDEGGRAYLMPVDGRWDNDEDLAATAISGDELEAALGAIAAPRVLVTFDCCHAGGLGTAKGPRRGVRATLPAAYVDRLGSGRGRVTIAASREDEDSWTMGGGGENSLFTHYMLEGLRGAAAGSDGFVYVTNLFRHISEWVPAQQAGQHPQFRADFEQDFAIAVGRYEPPTGAKGRPGREWQVYVASADDDEDWVYDVLIPKLTAAGISAGGKYELHDLGVPRLTNMERAMKAAERTIVVLSDASLGDAWTLFQTQLGHTITMEEHLARLMLVSPRPVTVAIPDAYRTIGVMTLTDDAPARVWRSLVEGCRRPAASLDPLFSGGAPAGPV